MINILDVLKKGKKMLNIVVLSVQFVENVGKLFFSYPIYLNKIAEISFDVFSLEMCLLVQTINRHHSFLFRQSSN